MRHKFVESEREALKGFARVAVDLGWDTIPDEIKMDPDTYHDPYLNEEGKHVRFGVPGLALHQVCMFIAKMDSGYWAARGIALMDPTGGYSLMEYKFEGGSKGSLICKRHPFSPYHQFYPHLSDDVQCPMRKA